MIPLDKINDPNATLLVIIVTSIVCLLILLLPPILGWVFVWVKRNQIIIVRGKDGKDHVLEEGVHFRPVFSFTRNKPLPKMLFFQIQKNYVTADGVKVLVEVYGRAVFTNLEFPKTTVDRSHLESLIDEISRQHVKSLDFVDLWGETPFTFEEVKPVRDYLLTAGYSLVKLNKSYVEKIK